MAARSGGFCDALFARHFLTTLQALRGTPTCYIFSCPQAQEQINPPFHSLVPYSSSREPGLVLVSLSGEIRFWQSIGIGLAGGDHFVSSSLGLEEDEDVTYLLRLDVSELVQLGDYSEHDNDLDTNVLCFNKFRPHL